MLHLIQLRLVLLEGGREVSLVLPRVRTGDVPGFVGRPHQSQERDRELVLRHSTEGPSLAPLGSLSLYTPRSMAPALLVAPMPLAEAGCVLPKCLAWAEILGKA